MNNPETPAPATTTRNSRTAITPHTTSLICVGGSLGRSALVQQLRSRRRCQRASEADGPGACEPCPNAALPSSDYAGPNCSTSAHVSFGCGTGRSDIRRMVAVVRLLGILRQRQEAPQTQSGIRRPEAKLMCASPARLPSDLHNEVGHRFRFDLGQSDLKPASRWGGDRSTARREGPSARHRDDGRGKPMPAETSMGNAWPASSESTTI
jgi:hypothetical protein